MLMPSPQRLTETLMVPEPIPEPLGTFRKSPKGDDQKHRRRHSRHENADDAEGDVEKPETE